MSHIWPLLLICAAPAMAGTAPTCQMLMSPECLPEAQHGMRVERAAIEHDQLRVVTTGAEFKLDPKTGLGIFRQRIGHDRDVLRLQVGRGFKGSPQLTHTGPGFAFARFASPRFDLRANGDSLYMLHAIEPVRLTISTAIEPAFHSSFRANHIVCDEWGGFGLYCSRPDIEDHFDPFEPTTARYDLPADTVLWIAICPPKPYDWKRASADHVVWHWSNILAYPPDDVLAAWAKQGSIVLLQSEVMLWKDWNLAFEPRLGPDEFARVRDTLHRLGMRFIVYTSPYYFLRGTSLQPAAFNSFKDFKNWPPGTATGENVELFLPEIARLMREHKPDGLYFDGQYTDNPAALYLLARRARAIIGEAGLLEWHSTFALGSERCSLPPADAYVDFILRGEGRDNLYANDEYLRYFVSGYNVHNSIGVICNNARPPTPQLLDRLLAVNGRMHTLAGWLADPKLAELVSNYRKRIGDVNATRTSVESQIDRRQQAVPERVRLLRDEHRQLNNPPAWGEPIMRSDFRTLEGWQRFASPLNKEAFAAGPDGLGITGRASTYAYLSRPINRPVQGFVVKLQRGTDGGASWGPAACMLWPGGGLVRVGLRNDGRVEAEIQSEQRFGEKIRPDEWMWLRARWGPTSGVIEISRDGQSFTRFWQFEHGGLPAGNPSVLLVGKVPYNGQPQDYVEPGPVGTSHILVVEVH